MQDAAHDQTTDTRPPAPFTRPPRRLCRDPYRRRIGGVASGVAAFIGLDTTVVRILFVVAGVVSGGTAIIAYLLAWALLPEPGDPETRLEAHLRERDFVVLAAGAVLLLILFGVVADGGWGWGWHPLFTPVALVAAGAVLLLHLDRKGGPEHQTIGAPSSDPTRVSEPLAAAGVVDAPPTLTPPWWAAGQPPPPPRRRRRADPRLRNLTLAAAFLFAAGATLLDALDALHVSTRFVLGGMLLVVAAGILVSVWWGRRRGLLGAALALSVGLAVACIPGLSLAGGIGQRIERPTTVAELPTAYRLGVGDYEIDLSGLDLPTSRTVRLAARLGAGRLTIDVPRSAQVDLSGHVSAGQLRVDDQAVGLSGVDVDLRHRIRGPSDAPHLNVSIDAGFADVEVHRVA